MKSLFMFDPLRLHYTKKNNNKQDHRGHEVCHGVCISHKSFINN